MIAGERIYLLPTYINNIVSVLGGEPLQHIISSAFPYDDNLFAR